MPRTFYGVKIVPHVPFASSANFGETPSNSASRTDPSCLRPWAQLTVYYSCIEVLNHCLYMMRFTLGSPVIR